MARLQIVVAYTLAAWNAVVDFNVHVEAVANHNYSDFGDSGWCFGAEDYYAGTTSSAEVRGSNHSVVITPYSVLKNELLGMFLLYCLACANAPHPR